jgi:DNA-binding NarL/FixJ family response regulator
METTGRRQGVRTVLAEGQRTVRDALRDLVTQGLGMQLVGEARTLQTLRRQVQERRPDLAIVDWDLLVQPASELADLRACSPSLRIVVIGLRPEMRPTALAAGADGFVSKVDAPDDVVSVLQPCPKTAGEMTGGLS